MVVRELFAKLGFKLDQKGLKQFESGLDQAKAGLKGIATIAAAGGASIIALATHTAHAAEEVTKLSTRTGVATDELQGLMHAAKLSDVETDQLAMGLTFLNRHMFEARNGGKEAAKAFQQLSPAVANAVRRGAGAGEVFKLTADAMQSIQDPAKRTALAVEIFGRSGATLIPFLVKGGASIESFAEEAKNLGIIFDHEALEASDKFNDSLKLMGQFAKGLKNIIGVGLVRALQPAIDGLIEFWRSSGQVIAQDLAGFFMLVFKVTKNLTKFLFNMVKAFNLLLKPFGGLLGVMKGLLVSFTAFKALQLVHGIGVLTQAIFALASTYQFMGRAAALAQLKAAAGPILIGLAVIALILLLEDLYVFMTGGGDSIIGLFAEKFPKAFENIKAVIGPTFMPLIELFKKLSDGTWTWLDALKLIGETIINAILMPFRLVSQTLGPLIEMIGRFSNSKLIQGIGSDINAGGKMLTARGFGEAFGIGQNGVNQTNQVQQQINVNVGANDDAATIAKKVGDASSTGLNDVFRNAGRTLQPGVAY